MNQASPQAFHQESTEVDAGVRALNRLVEAGFNRFEPPILQPASVFLDMSGEDIRGRLYLTSDADGAAGARRQSELMLEKRDRNITKEAAGSEAGGFVRRVNGNPIHLS